MKVKILEIYDRKNYWDDSEDILKPTEKTDWEECSKEDLAKLKDWASRKNIDPNHHYRYIVVTQSEIPVKEVLQEYVRIAKEDEKIWAEKETKKRARASKMVATKQKKKEAKEKKLLESLQAKYEGGGKMI